MAAVDPVTPPYEVTAFNTATASSNKIHDDDVARRFGFRGGLVPGVDVYAYLAHLPVARWGRAWLDGGTMAARFAAPVYDGEHVTVVGRPDGRDLELTLDGPDATTRATGRATRLGATATADVPPWAPLPTERPPASPATLAPGTVLGSLADHFSAAEAPTYLADVRDDEALYRDEGLAHPGWLLRFANSVLVANVVLGPWIHVGSDVDMLSAVTDGQDLDVRAVVVGEHERKGHRFVDLDVAVLADGAVAQRIAHTAIHTPRGA